MRQRARGRTGYTADRELGETVTQLLSVGLSPSPCPEDSVLFFSSFY